MITKKIFLSKILLVVPCFLLILSLLLASCSGQTALSTQNNPTNTPAVSSTPISTVNNVQTSPAATFGSTNSSGPAAGSAPVSPPSSNIAGSGNQPPAKPGSGPSGNMPANGAPPTGNPPGGSPGSGGPPHGLPGAAPGGMPSGDSAGASTVTGTSVYSQSGDSVAKSGQNITASNQNQSAVKITNSGMYSLNDSTVSTTGSASSMDDASFYGLDAAVLAESGSKITLSNVKVTTTGSGANGVFATGQGSIINLSDVTINCTNTGAHGVDATLGGTLTLKNVNITTAGNGASAAIATNRGGGTIKVTGGTAITSGTKSPPIYSTGAITVTGAVMKATNSEAVAIEGKNSVILTDTSLSGAKNWGVIIYQSMSGDAEVGTGNFTMTGGTLTAEEGPMFYSTNTQSVINLKGAALVFPSGILKKARAGDWGTSGSNGAQVAFTADNEILNGTIICDKISTVTLTLKNNTTLKGHINAEHTAKTVTLSLDQTSIWEVAGNSYLTSITDEDASLANIHSNGYTVYYNASSSTNSWLGSKTFDLTGGGHLVPGT
jgi:hypothetical protein